MGGGGEKEKKNPSEKLPDLTLKLDQVNQQQTRKKGYYTFKCVNLNVFLHICIL